MAQESQIGLKSSHHPTKIHIPHEAVNNTLY